MSVRHRQDRKKMMTDNTLQSSMHIEPQPLAWNNTRRLDHYSAYWLIRDECDTVTNVSTVDSLGGVWDIKIGVIRNLQGPDMVIATSPLRGWAVWKQSDHGVAFLAATLDFRCEPIPGRQWP